MNRDEFITACQNWLCLIDAINGDVREFICEPPCSVSEIVEFEKEMGLVLPSFMHRALIEISSHVEFRWFLPKDFPRPTRFKSNFCGEIHWSLDLLKEYHESKQGWIANCFPNKNDPYDKVWHNTLAFHHVANGDFLAVSLNPESYEKVVYLSHDDGEGHGFFLANNFIDLLDRWVPLGCPGGED
jgi:hypothetical protein